MLRYRRSGQGPTLVLQHGFLSGSAYWENQVKAFAPDHDLIMPDLPGFGGSPTDLSATTISAMSERVVALLDHLGVERFSFLGHSMGGMIAQQIALDHGDRLDRLVLYGTSPVGETPGRFETLERSIDRLRKEGIPAAARRIVPTWFVAGTESAEYAAALQLALAADGRGAEQALRAVAAWDSRARTSSITMPTLVMCGDRDRSGPPAIALQLWGRIADADLCIVPHCAHNVHLERPDLFVRLVREFLAPLRRPQ